MMVFQHLHVKSASHLFFLFILKQLSANKTKVLYGLQPEPDFGITIEDDNEEEEDKDKPKVHIWGRNRRANPGGGLGGRNPPCHT